MREDGGDGEDGDVGATALAHPPSPSSASPSSPSSPPLRLFPRELYLPDMTHHQADKAFVGSLPQIYQSHLVPLIFEPYADDLAGRLAARPVSRVLEIAAGTGAVTRRLASTLPAAVPIVATDLNRAMLDQAEAQGTSRPVEWRQADAMQLPFEDGGFDAVVCQFGVMFFPDKARAFAEARRVLRPGGRFLFSVWDRIEENDFADTVTAALAAAVPGRPAPLPGPHAARPRRSGRPGARRGRGRLHPAAGDHDGAGAEPRRVSGDPGGGILPGHAAPERDRGPRRAAGRGDRRRNRGRGATVWTRRRGREDAGRRGRGRAPTLEGSE